jgi:tRNA U34 5-methylaminomethyl-2-thiouridine-forming methyltransferase MnmC
LAISDRQQLNTDDPRFRILVTDDGSRSLVDTVLNESYRSGFGAASESYFVYLINSGIAARLQAAPVSTTRILEYGFGTGMNFLMSASLASSLGRPLEYWSFENRLLPCNTFEQLRVTQALAQVELAKQIPNYLERAHELMDRFLEFRDPLGEESHGERTCVFGNGIQLTLGLGDATLFEFPKDLAPFHAVYFDAFSPKTSPDLWSLQVLQTAYSALELQGRLVSYCVSRAVQKLLSECGFVIQKTPGPPGGKREVLIAIRPSAHREIGGGKSMDIDV